MSAASNYLENALLDHVLGGGDEFTQPETVYLALFTGGDGLESGSLTDEVAPTGTGYARQAVTFGEADSGSASNSATVTFDAATGNWGTVTHVAVMDAALGGNVLFHGAVTTAKTIETGDTFQVSSGNLTITLA